jgi:ribosomal-protein-alanine N-acetyltransferase
VDFVIRPYRAADFDRLWEIDQQCFPSGIAYSQMELTGFITRRNAITRVAEHATPQSEPASEITQTGQGANTQEREKSSQAAKSLEAAKPDRREANPLLGFAIAHPYRKSGRILTLDIVPEARRHGLASRLMEDCEARLRQRGCSEVYLETAVDNQPALKLYHKLGYQILRTLPGYYHAYGLDAFLMGKAL